MSNPTTPPLPPFRQQTPAILLLTVVFLMNFTGRVVLAPLLPSVEEEMALTHAQAGMSFLFLSAGYLIAMTVSGYFSARLKHRGAIVLSLTLLGLSTLGVAWAPTLAAMRAGLFCMGFGSGLYLPSAIATITSLVASRDWGKAIAIHELAPNVSFFGVPLLAELLLRVSSWRACLLYLGAVTFVTGSVYAVFGRGGRFAGRPPELAVVGQLVRNPLLWVVLLLFVTGVGATLGVFAMLPLYLVSTRGMEEGWANTLTGLSRLACPLVALAAGWVSDRFGVRRTLTVTLVLTGAATMLLGLVADSWLTLVVFLQPSVSAGFFPAGFTALSTIGDASSRSTAVSLVVPLAFVLGGGLVPWFLGLSGDLGAFHMGFVWVGLFFLWTAWLARATRN